MNNEASLLQRILNHYSTLRIWASAAEIQYSFPDIQPKQIFECVDELKKRNLLRPSDENETMTVHSKCQITQSGLNLCGEGTILALQRKELRTARIKGIADLPKNYWYIFQPVTFILGFLFNVLIQEPTKSHSQKDLENKPIEQSLILSDSLKNPFPSVKAKADSSQ